MTEVTSTRRRHGADSTLDGAEVDTVGVPQDQPQSGASLFELAAFFTRKPSPLIIGTTALAATATRVWLGKWSRWDLAVPAIILAAEPFVEWTIHVHVLHRRPTRIGRLTIDPVTARKHRLHHRNPKDLRIVMVPFQALFPAAPIAVGLAVWRLDPAQAAASIAVGFGMLFTYEWVHYLIHAPYRPKTAWFRRVSRNHRRHHYRNEHYWFGVTNSFGDRVLRTRPAPADVPLSGTVRTLGLEAPERGRWRRHPPRADVTATSLLRGGVEQEPCHLVEHAGYVEIAETGLHGQPVPEGDEHMHETLAEGRHRGGARRHRSIS